MKLSQKREFVEPSALRLPTCPLPRPGDVVVWFQSSVRYQGKLVGHTFEGLPYVQIKNRGERQLTGYNSIRLLDPDAAIGPNWARLPSGGTLTRPYDQERKDIEQFLERIVPSGISHRTLTEEIWCRGYEVFLTGGTIRDVLAEGEARDAEFATTMPLDRLHAVVLDMYGPDKVTFGSWGRELGRLRVGGVELNPADAFADVRVFRCKRPGTAEAVFGGSFEDDIQHGDLACNAVYYDPINQIFIDPTGKGIDDATGRCLRLVFEQTDRPADEMARIGLRLIRFLLNGYSLAPENEKHLLTLLMQLPALPLDLRVAAVKTEIFNSTTNGQKSEVWMRVYEIFFSCDLEPLWLEHIKPHREELLS